MSLVRWPEVLVALFLLAAPAAWAETATAPDPLAPVRSMGSAR